MNNIKSATVEFVAGTHITDATEQGLELAKQLYVPVTLKFNEISVLVHPTDTTKDVETHYAYLVRASKMLP